MLRHLVSPSPAQLGKWCAYAVVLLAPGSLIVLPLYLISRHWRAGK